jgi:hypothetical protein
MAVDVKVLRDILDREWEMFHSVQGIDGPAACQQDRKTFEVMRSSQLFGWNQAVAESYLDDLRQAEAAGRNLMTEKYARMMEYTSPCEYRRIAGRLPELEKGAATLVQRLMEQSVKWMEEVAAKYPHVMARARPLRAESDNRHIVSFETYSRGELATYSLRTLQLLDEHYRQMAAAGENQAELILRHTAESSGFASLERAEAAQKAAAERRRASASS